jgi:hypothetical protein
LTAAEVDLEDPGDAAPVLLVGIEPVRGEVGGDHEGVPVDRRRVRTVDLGLGDRVVAFDHDGPEAAGHLDAGDPGLRSG